MCNEEIIFGILVGLLLGVTGTTFATQYIAEDANFPVLVNGKTFTTDKPIVTINGSKYMPLKAMGEALGVKISWNSNLSRVEIGETEMSSVKSNDEKDYSSWVLFETDNSDFVRDGILKGEIIYYKRITILSHQNIIIL